MTQVASRPGEPVLDPVPKDGPAPTGHSWRRWMGTGLSSRWCVLGWIVATGLFLVFATVGGYPGKVDAQESVYSTWAIAHGEFNCAFPPVTMPHEPLVAPVYPLVSGGVAAVAAIGHQVPFPGHAAMGAHCDGADAAIRQWALRAGAFGPTRAIGVLGWLVLAAGIVAWLRAAGRGRTRWEPATLMALAVLPPVTSCVGLYLHPQDLMALGLALGATACALRTRWVAAGALIALAVLTQQFALLVAAPLFVLAPRGRRARYVGGGALTAVALVAPLFVLSGGTVVRAITLGSGDNPSIGGTMLWELGHSGAVVLLGSRVLPIVLTLALTWWAVRRLGPAASSPVVLMSIVATSLSLRLVLEQNIFEYYFMALVVTLVLLEVTQGRIRGSVVAWLVALVLTFSLDNYFLNTTSGLHLQRLLPGLVLVEAVALGALGIVRRRHWPRWNVVLWAAVAFCALSTWSGGLALPLPTWPIQAVFTITGTALAVTPLLEAVRSRAGRPRAAALSSPSPASG